MENRFILFTGRTLFSIVLCLSLPGFCLAQTRDTLTKEPNNLQRHTIMTNGSDYRPKVTSFIVPAVFIGYGVVSLSGHNAIRHLDLTTKAELQEDHPAFALHADNYMQYVPVAAFYGLNLAGIKSKHSVADGTGLFILSEAIMTSSTFIVKRAVDRRRPDGSNNFSFPSGHTANAFASAELLNQEYKDVSPWVGYAGYTVATATGVLRMYNNKHWLSDVVAGAGFGILSTKVAYFIYPTVKRLILGKNASNYSVIPTYQQHSFGLSFNGTF